MENRFKDSFKTISSSSFPDAWRHVYIHILFVNGRQIMEDNANPRQVCGRPMAKLSIGMENIKGKYLQRNEEMCK